MPTLLTDAQQQQQQCCMQVICFLILCVSDISVSFNGFCDVLHLSIVDAHIHTVVSTNVNRFP